MPTGYTADIKKGISFKEFVLHAACGMFYDCSKLPDEDEEVSDYYIKKIDELTAELKRIEDMSDTELEIAARKEYNKGVRDHKKYKDGRAELKKKYETILEQVKSWKPPSENHVTLKNFMIQQIEMSIESDCYDIDDPDYTSVYLKPKMTGNQWLIFKKREILKNLKYYSEEDQKERERIVNKNIWIKQLRESLE